MKQTMRLVCLAALTCLLFSAVVTAQIEFNCDKKTVSDAAELVINQMRSGGPYTVTVIGLEGFDPIVGVFVDGGSAVCADDTADARSMGASLPTSGDVAASAKSAQVRFSQDSAKALANVSIYVGSSDGNPGQFILLIEGMAATPADNIGDIFSARLMPNTTLPDSVLSAYMISVVQEFDPYLYLLGADDTVVVDAAGAEMSCDDAGSACWGTSEKLSSSFVARAGGRDNLPGGDLDAMMSIAVGDFGGLDLTSEARYLTFIMRSAQSGRSGDYIAAFHMSIGAPGSGGRPNFNNNSFNNAGTTTGSTGSENTNAAGVGGYSFTCDKNDYANAVEIIIPQMRSGGPYTITALGVDDFNPVVGVFVKDGSAVCNQDSSDAAAMSVDLPTTGSVSGSRSSAQVQFRQDSGQGLQDVSLFIADENDRAGEFVVIMEGMRVTPEDGIGDIFRVRLQANNAYPDAFVNAYLVSVVQQLDPYVFLLGSDSSPLVDDNDTAVECDDAGSNSCWGENEKLSGSFVSRSGGRDATPGGDVDAMLAVPMSFFIPTDDIELDFTEDYGLNFIFNSSAKKTQGEYIGVFHMKIR